MDFFLLTIQLVLCILIVENSYDNTREEARDMADKIFLNFQVPPELLTELDDYRFRRRKVSRAEAARELLFTALQEAKQDDAKKQAQGALF